MTWMDRRAFVKKSGAALAGCAALPVFSSGLAAAVAPPAEYLKGLVDVLKKPWPGNRTVNVVAHGHSVPSGYFRTPIVRTFDSYPHLLHRFLGESYPYAVTNVIVTAIGGEGSEKGAARFEADVLTKKPDVVLIDYSLNDRGMGLERASKAWTSMIEAAAQRSVPVILLTPTPDISTVFTDVTLPICQHAGQVRALAAKHQVGLADSFAAFQRYVERGGGLRDVLSQVNHPNRRGHELVLGELIPFFWSPDPLMVR